MPPGCNLGHHFTRSLKEDNKMETLEPMLVNREQSKLLPGLVSNIAFKTAPGAERYCSKKHATVRLQW